MKATIHRSSDPFRTEKPIDEAVNHKVDSLNNKCDSKLNLLYD